MKQIQTGKRYHFKRKLQKKKKFCLKIRLMLTIVLPIFILVLFIQVVKTFIRIKIRKLFTRPFHDSASAKPSAPVPVKPVPLDKEILHPELLSGEQKKESDK